MSILEPLPGVRPLNQVPKSTFALANLVRWYIYCAIYNIPGSDTNVHGQSPFQPGYGSLQVIAAHQPNIPSGFNNEFDLCGLRQDDISSSALGVFNECRPIDVSENRFKWNPAHISGQREPGEFNSLNSDCYLRKEYNVHY